MSLLVVVVILVVVVVLLAVVLPNAIRRNKTKRFDQEWRTAEWEQCQSGLPVKFWLLDDCQRVFTLHGTHNEKQAGISNGIRYFQDRDSNGNVRTETVRRSVVFIANPYNNVNLSEFLSAPTDAEKRSAKKLAVGDEEVMDAESWKRLSRFRAKLGARNVGLSKYWFFVEVDGRWLRPPEAFAHIDVMRDLILAAQDKAVSGKDYAAEFKRIAAADRPWWKKSRK